MKKPLLAAALLCASASLFAQTAQTAQTAQPATPCPKDLANVATCYTGADQNGATYWIAIPQNWNKVLVMHAHGGPRLKAIDRDSSLEDIERFSVTVRQGFAWAGSSYRRPGYGVKMAAEDTENLRQIFVKQFGKPEKTILHGQSWGGNVAAKGAELYPASYDGVILTAGMLGGASMNYIHRADLRAVYQYYCKNHPRPDEPQYPLWMGLPANAKMSNKDLEDRINECTGLKLPAAQRSEQQRANLANILGVIHVPERSLQGHMNWSTFLFRDLVQRVLGGSNPFSNRTAAYKGSSDDAALNRDVIRFDADPAGVAKFEDDSGLTGKITVPVLTMHAIDDPTALVEYEAVYRDVVTRAGNGAKLTQVFTTENEHSKLADVEYVALFSVMLDALRNGRQPAAEQVYAACTAEAAKYSGGCHFSPGFQPKPLFSRVTPR